MKSALRQKLASEAMCTCSRATLPTNRRAMKASQLVAAFVALRHLLPSQWVARYSASQRSKRPFAKYTFTIAEIPPWTSRALPTMTMRRAMGSAHLLAAHLAAEDAEERHVLDEV